MDLVSVKAAYDGLKFAKDVFSAFSELKNETETITKINEAVKRVGEAQDALYELREELFRLQEENNLLRQKVSKEEDWNQRLSEYELTETEGGAVVYKAIKGTTHYICPSCVVKKEIHPLQDRRVVAGVFDCPGCGKQFPIKPLAERRGSVKVTRC